MRASERATAQVTGTAAQRRGYIVYSLDPVTSTTSPTERVGRYQLLEPIGIGPSGSVSRAKVFGVAGFERQFAVKRFHTELTATAASAAMLSAAARAYGSLEHPRIARMSEFGVAQGATFTAVEYVLGLDALRLVGEARLAGVTLAAGGALALVSQAARAVGYAHGRGLTHLGLAPTNVIVTAEGDIKITDFGILSATLPQRPIDVARLTQRIPYLAPEQLANEATSAATDVFALGVLAYELVTGSRTFKGDTPQQVASAIMAGPPAEPPLPRPIVRVLQRCLARSPFERFPDARALADALDAALRVAPVPGTRKDIGAQVKETLDRLAALNDGQMSGMVALHLGTGPIRRLSDDDVRSTGGPPADPAAMLSYELADRVSQAPGTTMPDLPRPPITTMPGVAPPPIPVPPGLSPPGTPSTSSAGASTLLGMGKPPAIPPIKPRTAGASAIPMRPPAVPLAALRAQSRTEAPIAIEPAAPRAQFGAAQDGAIHTLDPSDLVQLDELHDVDDLDAGLSDATALGPAGLAELAADPPERAPTSSPFSDDFLDAPTKALNEPRKRPTIETSAARLTMPATPAARAQQALFDEIPGATSGTGSGPAPSADSEAKSGSGPAAKSGSGPAAKPASGAPATSPGPLGGSGASARPTASAGSGPTASAGSGPNASAGSGSGPTAGSGLLTNAAPSASSSGSGPTAGSGPTSSAGSGPTVRAGSGLLGMPTAPKPTAGLTAPTAGRGAGPSAALGAPTAPEASVASAAPPNATDADRAITATASADTRFGTEASTGDAAAFEAATTGDIDILHGALDRPSGQTILGFAAPLPRPATPTPSGVRPMLAEPGPPPAPSQWQRPLGETQPEDIQPSPSGPHRAPVEPSPSGPHRAPIQSSPSGPHRAPVEPSPQPPSNWVSTPASPGPPLRPGPPPITPLARGGRRTGTILLGLLGLAGLGVGAWQLYEHSNPGTSKPVVAPTPARRDAGTVAVASPDTARDAATDDASPADAGKLDAIADAGKLLDAGKLDAGKLLDAAKPALDAAKPALDAAKPALDAGAPPDAASGTTAPATADTLAIASTPPGARVFLDGADTGTTPVKLPGSPDRHTIALMLANHELYVAQVDGHGAFSIPLKEVTPVNGPAGIKVLRCKPDRYYVFVDGKPTGQTCPTERIGCEVGAHTVEVYDVVSETRRKWDIVVKDTRLSFRVRVE